MHRWVACFSVLFAALAGLAARTPSRDALDIYAIDVEGGQATLFVAPSGQSMLVDTGFAGVEGRDAARIAAAAREAGVTRLDYVVITHYHRDHVGGVPELAARLPIGRFIDHGSSVEHTPNAVAVVKAYEEVARDRRTLAKPGDLVPLSGVDVRIVSAAGAVLEQPLPGGGERNALCAAFEPKDPDRSENAQSVGLLVTYGAFRLADLGDLTWNKEQELVCPENPIGRIDLYLVSHHGSDASGSPVLVHALRPRVAVMNNGATKGGSKEAWQTIRRSPGLEDLWQLHTAVENGSAYNAADSYIANPDETTAYWIKISASEDGSFVVTNQRNGFSKTYAAVSRNP